MNLRRRAARPVAAGLLLGLVLGPLVVLLGPAAPASAHAYLLGSDPPRNALLSTSPEQVVLTFSEEATPVPGRVLVVGPDGEPVNRGEPTGDGDQLTIPVDDTTVLGTYLVTYRVISADSHPAGGSFTYSVGAPSETPPVPPVENVDDPVVRTGLGAARYAGYAGLVLLVGPAVVLALLWPQRLPRDGMARLMWTGAGLVAVSAVASVWFQVPYSTGVAMSEVSADGVRDVLGTPYGQAHLVRLGVLGAAVWLLRTLVGGYAARTDLVLLCTLGVVGLGTWAVAGHPIASPLPAASVVATMVHLGAAAFWIGGLVVLVGVLLRRADERELGVILPIWSGWAAVAVVALLLGGVFQILMEVGTPGAFVTTTYGRVLLAKVGLVGVVIAVAGYSRRLVRRRVGALRPRAMGVAVTVEAAVLAMVVGLSSVLVQTIPARVEAAGGPEGVATDFFATTRESDLYAVQVTLEPTTVGTNTVHLYVFTLEGGPLPVEEWDVTMGGPGADGPVDVPLEPISDNHTQADVSMPVAGQWEFDITLWITGEDEASVSVAVPIDE